MLNMKFNNKYLIIKNVYLVDNVIVYLLCVIKVNIKFI